MSRRRFPFFLVFTLVLVLLQGRSQGAWGAQSPATPEPANPLTETGRWEWESPTFSDVYALDHDNIYAAGKGFWRSTNGGASWTQVQLYEPTAFSAVRFATRRTATCWPILPWCTPRATAA